MTNEQYLEWGGLYCPLCHSTNIDNSELQTDGHEVFKPMECLSCDTRWNDVYKLANIEIIYRGK